MSVSAGQRYHNRDMPYVVWEVAKLTKGPDALLYAQLRRVDEWCTTKTLSCHALSDPRSYNWVPGDRRVTAPLPAL